MASSIPIKNKVREMREKHGGLSQSELGKMVYVTRQTIAAIEQGRYSPSLETAFRIAKVFGVGLDDIFEWDDEEG